jgi:thioredoxin-dependent peroxiredoxin
MIHIGDVAPDFTAAASDGHRFALGEHRGRVVVVYFFPKAFTPGCTAETKTFRDNYDELRGLGADVVGVSCDDVATQCRFATKHGVRFPLVGDPDRAISRAYGVLWPIVPIDKRITVVVDEGGKVAAIFRHEFQVSKHLDDVMNFLRKRVS